MSRTDGRIRVEETSAGNKKAGRSRSDGLRFLCFLETLGHYSLLYGLVYLMHMKCTLLSYQFRSLMKVLKPSLAKRRCSVCSSDFLYMGSVKKKERQSVFFCTGRLLFPLALLMVRVRPD